MDKRTYGAAPSAYATFGSITGAIAALWLVAVWRADAPLLPVLVPAVGFGVVALWLSGFRLTFAGSQITYSRLFGRKRHFTLDEILSVEFADVTGPTESPATLSVRLVSGEEVRLNAKVFPRVAVQSLLALGQKTKFQRRPR